MTIDYETEYNNRARVPEHPQIFESWTRDAAAYRAQSPGAKIGQAYGPSPRQTLDVFPGKNGSGGPLALFIHGGYWRSLEPSQFSHMAKGPNAHGVTVAVAGYDLSPQVSIAEIIDQMRAACVALWRAQGRRFTVYGHSAGGHLASCMMATDWKALDRSAPADLVPSAYSVSGVFDLTPLMHIAMNQDFKLDISSARAVSPMLWPAPKGGILDCVVGGIESGEFLRQSREMADAWKGSVSTRYEEVPGANHFTVVAPLADANSAMTARVVELARKAAG